jgi:hypothetical protein
LTVVYIVYYAILQYAVLYSEIVVRKEICILAVHCVSSQRWIVYIAAMYFTRSAFLTNSTELRFFRN